MKSRTWLLGGAVLLAGTTVFGHHLQAGLSSVLGSETLTEILYVAKSGKIGVAPHVIGTEDPSVDVLPHSSFTVTDADGNSETVTVLGGMFANPAQADVQEVVEALGSQLTLAEMVLVNDTLVIRGKDGGAASSLTLTEGTGGLLGSLGILSTTAVGTDDIEISLSIPSADGHHHHHETGSSLAGHAFYMILSTTEGVTNVAGKQIPVLFDATTSLGIRAMNLGLLPGFFGHLDANEDAVATFDTALLPKLFPDQLPERLFLTFVVFNETLTGLDYVSNRFDVVIED